MQIYAQDQPYWQTSKSPVDTWMDKCEVEIKRAGGMILSKGIVTAQGKTTVGLEFSIGTDLFRIVWQPLPLNPRKTGTEKAALVQAVTAMYYDIKNSCIKARWVGARRAFADYFLLPSGDTVGGHIAVDRLDIPQMFLIAAPKDAIEGEYVSNTR